MDLVLFSETWPVVCIIPASNLTLFCFILLGNLTTQHTTLSIVFLGFFDRFPISLEEVIPLFRIYVGVCWELAEPCINIG